MTPSSGQQTEQARYAAAWRESRRRWWRLLAYWIGGPFVIIAVELTFHPPELVITALALTWMIGSGFLAFSNAGFPCPRCGEAFYLRGLYGNSFPRHCLHCRLRWGSKPQ